MKSQKPNRLAAVFLCAVGGVFALVMATRVSATPRAGGAVFQDPLPDGPGRDALVAVCGKCHEPQRAASVRLTRDGWQATIDDMVTRGAKGSDEQFSQILDYLATNFLGEGARPLSVNTAPAIDFESVLGLLRKEAASVIAYRTKHGAFKTVDDFKKVPGLDFKKVEARKERLFFGDK